MRLRPRHVRARLTLWYVLVLAAILLLYAGGSVTFLLWDLRGQLYSHAVQDIETVEGLLSFGPGGRIFFKDDYHNHPESKLIQERYLEVLSIGGVILFRNDRLGTQSLGGPPLPDEGQGGYSPGRERLSDGTRILLISRRHSIESKPILIRLAYSEEPLWGQFTQLLWALVLGFPMALAGAGFGGYALAGRFLRPVEEMTVRASQITPENLDERLPVENPEDELGKLGLVFNLTLDRLEQSFVQLKHFTADASHELRTPLASIRSVGEVALQRDCTSDQYRETIGSMLEESSRLTRLVDSLLVISRADVGETTLQRSRFQILDPIREAANLLEVLLDEKSQRLVIDGDGTTFVEGDRLILRQAFVNLLHNAVKYSPVGGEISMRAHVDGQSVIVTVQDSGPGIPAEHAARVFDRFYRPDFSRSRDLGGAGLGLAITKWAIEAHGGSVTVASSEPKTACGARFRIEVPLRLD